MGTVMGTNGMVACSQRLASLVGVQVLSQGGNAVDAAVAAAAMLGVLEPMSIGIGGDAFALLYVARTGEMKALDASGRSPYGVDAAFFRAQGLHELPQSGIHSVTVPGAVHGWETLLKEYGTRTLGDLLDPAIRYAEEGFPVNAFTSHEWRNLEDKLRKNAEAAAGYLVRDRAPRPGEVFRQPDLARTMRGIAEGGVEFFYRGEVAEKLVLCSQKLGGNFSMRDMEAHASEWVDPIHVDYRGYEVYQLPPATQGFVALEMLKILEGYDLSSREHNGADYLHLFIEAKKRAFADRDQHLADRESMTVSLQDLLSEARAGAMRDGLSRREVAVDVAAAPVPGDTEYIAVADGQGNRVSFIQSLFMGFGSGVAVEDTGIILQNRGHMFNLDPGHPNCLEPHKRCSHTLMPGMVCKGGEPVLVVGLKGGHVQAQVQSQIIANVVDFGMAAQEALAAPRFNHLSGADVSLEPGFSGEAVSGLEARGHRVVSGPAESFGGANAIAIEPESGVLMGASDPRKDGCAIGF